jgi:hypothetical protein
MKILTSNQLDKLEVNYVKAAAKTFKITQIEAACMITSRFLMNLQTYMTKEQYKAFLAGHKYNIRECNHD